MITKDYLLFLRVMSDVHNHSKSHSSLKVKLAEGGISLYRIKEIRWGGKLALITVILRSGRYQDKAHFRWPNLANHVHVGSHKDA